MADPMADAFGRGIDTNPEEIAGFRKECKELGISIQNREREALSYQPNPTIGRPGQLTINPGASYAAWCHEMKHVYDDRDSGWDGALQLWNRDEHFRRETEAYNIEIRMALEGGRPDVADLLRQNLEEEKRRIYGTE